MEIREGEPRRDGSIKKPTRKRELSGPRKPGASSTTLNYIGDDIPSFVNPVTFWKQVVAEYKRLRKKRYDLGELSYLAKNQVNKSEAVRLHKLQRDTWSKRRMMEISIGISQFHESIARYQRSRDNEKRKQNDKSWELFQKELLEESRIRKGKADTTYAKEQLRSLEKKLKYQAIENVKKRLAEKWRKENGVEESPERRLPHPVFGSGREAEEGIDQDTQPTGSVEGCQGI